MRFVGFAPSILSVGSCASAKRPIMVSSFRIRLHTDAGVGFSRRQIVVAARKGERKRDHLRSVTMFCGWNSLSTIFVNILPKPVVCCEHTSFRQHERKQQGRQQRFPLEAMHGLKMTAEWLWQMFFRAARDEGLHGAGCFERRLLSNALRPGVPNGVTPLQGGLPPAC